LLHVNTVLIAAPTATPSAAALTGAAGTGNRRAQATSTGAGRPVPTQNAALAPRRPAPDAILHDRRDPAAPSSGRKGGYTPLAPGQLWLVPPCSAVHAAGECCGAEVGRAAAEASAGLLTAAPQLVIGQGAAAVAAAGGAQAAVGTGPRPPGPRPIITGISAELINSHSFARRRMRNGGHAKHILARGL
jgi:hypothetical protein